MFWVDDLRMKLVTDGVVAFMIFDIWVRFSVNTRHHRDFFGGGGFFSDAIKKKGFGSLIRLWRSKMHKKMSRFCMIQYVWCPPSIHYLYVRATVLLCSDAHLQLQTEEWGGSREKGTLICMWGASLAKAEDNRVHPRPQWWIASALETHLKVGWLWPSSAWLPQYVYSFF